jgi:hypothetical protein
MKLCIWQATELPTPENGNMEDDPAYREIICRPLDYFDPDFSGVRGNFTFPSA